MMGVNGMNGTGQTVPVPQTFGEHTPLAYMQPIAITPGSIKWVVGGVIAAIWSLYTADFLYRPAKATDLDHLSKVVVALDAVQKETSLAVQRLTLAVDNLAGQISQQREVIVKRPLAPVPARQR